VGIIARLERQGPFSLQEQTAVQERSLCAVIPHKLTSDMLLLAFVIERGCQRYWEKAVTFGDFSARINTCNKIGRMQQFTAVK
jgi:hypothetical protein